jgi:hypothetical protein
MLLTYDVRPKRRRCHKMKFEDLTDIAVHHVWDSSIAEKMLGGNRRKTYDNAYRWATDLTEEIKSGKYQTESSLWVQGLLLDDPIATSMVWANESNAYVCSHGKCHRYPKLDVQNGLQPLIPIPQSFRRAQRLLWAKSWRANTSRKRLL